jgi:hypothetical protein
MNIISTRFAGVFALPLLASLALLPGCGFESSSDPKGTFADGGVVGQDGSATDGGSVDLVQLTDTSGDLIAPQSSVVCYAPGAQSTEDGSWIRTFRLADWGHAGAFQVTAVTFWVTSATSARGILVGLGSYGGVLGRATIDPASIAPIASVTTDVADVSSGATPEQVVVPIDAEIGSSQVLLVTVRAPSLRGVSGSFHLGSTSSSEVSPGYFSSTFCSIPYRSTESLGITGHLAIEVVGRWLTR